MSDQTDAILQAANSPHPLQGLTTEQALLRMLHNLIFDPDRKLAGVKAIHVPPDFCLQKTDGLSYQDLIT